jgi:hypothetical protein
LIYFKIIQFAIVKLEDGLSQFVVKLKSDKKLLIAKLLMADNTSLRKEAGKTTKDIEGLLKHMKTHR